jgi:hypothetical protein
MAGYFAERVNTGTLDPLTARAIVFRQGSVQAALVFCDVVSIPREVASRAREEASGRTGIPAGHIAVAATHSHTGPLFHGVLRDKFHERATRAGGKDESEAVDYPALLAERVARAVERARDNAVEARLEAGTANEGSISFNRRFHMKDGTVRFNPGPLNPDIVRPAGPIDPEVGILLVRPSAGGQSFAGLTVFALHLDTVGGTSYSADYPQFLELGLREAFGPTFVSLFGTGTCGDINHIDVTRRERLKTEVIGRTLARDVSSQADKLSVVAPVRLSVARTVVDTPLQQFTADEVGQARRVLDSFEAAKTSFLETVRVCKVVDLADHYKAETELLEVQAFRLGPELAIVTLPGEVFVELGLTIKKGSPFRNTFVIELANACPAYVPTKKAFAEGSYEIVNSRIAPGGGEKLAEAAIGLLKKLGEAGR